MSWASGNKKWIIPFVSLNGTECSIDIYKRGYTGDTVITLSPSVSGSPGCAGAMPIYFEEDNDEDLLTVLRVKTGYISLVEMTYGGLVDLYPDTDRDHYIEFYYGTTLMFNGFIQAQSFDNDWVAPPREVQLPIQSPLGLCEGLKLASAAPSIKSRDTYLNEIVAGLGAAYTGFILPGSIESFSLKSSVVCEINENPNETDGSDMYTPISYAEYLETFCYLYGLILHDTPTKLVFSRFDEDGEYSGTSAIGATVRNIADYFTIASDGHKESTIQPLKDIRIDYDGASLADEDMSVSQMPFVQKDSGTLSVAAWFKMLGPRFANQAEMVSLGISGERPTSQGVYGAVAGGLGGQSEGVMVYNGSNYLANTPLFVYKFFNYPIIQDGENCVLRLGMTRGEYIYNCTEEGMFLDFSVGVVGSNGQEEFYNPQTFEWTTTEVKLGSYYGQDSDGMWLRNVPVGLCLCVHFYYWNATALPANNVCIVTEMSLSATKSNQWAYKYSQEFSKKLPGAQGAKKSGSFGLVFNRDRSDDHSTMWNSEYPYTAPTFSYMFLTQNRLQLEMKLSGTFPTDIYITKWAFWITGWRWRIIAVGFDPRNDVYTITMHRSSVIENENQ